MYLLKTILMPSSLVCLQKLLTCMAITWLSHGIVLSLFVALYSGKVWQGKGLVNLLFSSIWKNVWSINRSSKRLVIVSTNLDRFSLVNHR